MDKAEIVFKKHPRRFGNPRTDVERVMSHYKITETEAQAMLKDSTIEKLLPSRGSGVFKSAGVGSAIGAAAKKIKSFFRTGGKYIKQTAKEKSYIKREYRSPGIKAWERGPGTQGMKERSKLLTLNTTGKRPPATVYSAEQKAKALEIAREHRKLGI